jgi:hydrogenase/urease accessory protein HupE
MKTSFVRGLALAISFLTSRSLVQAHPGHDDHEITWDFSHLAAHPIATIACCAVVIGVGLGGWLLVRRFARANSTVEPRQP